MAARKTAKKTGSGARAAKAPQKASKAKGPAKKVWAIVNHQSRLQSTQQRIDVLQTSSPYIQMPVRPRSNTPDLILFAQQLDSLLAEGKTQVAWMRFWLIASWSYDTTIKYKGHLLGIRRKPATVREIAAAMRCTTAEARRTLGVLERTGLVERIDCPDFDAIEPPPSRRAGSRDDDRPDGDGSDGKTAKKAAKKTGKKATKKASGKKTSDRKPPKNAVSDGAGEDVPPRAMARGGRPSRKVKNGKVEESLKTASGKSAAPPKENQTANGCAERGGESPAPNGQRPGRAETLKFHKRGEVIEITNPNAEGRAETTPTAPTASPPILPTVADAGRVTQRDASTGDRNGPPSSDSRPTRPKASRIEQLYDSTAREFASEIYRAIGVPHSPTSPDGARELGCFAAAWSEAQAAGLSVGQLERLWTKSVAEAGKLGRKRRRTTWRKGPEAVWRGIYNRRLMDYRGRKTAVG